MISTLIHEIGKGTKNAAVKKRVISFFMKILLKSTEQLKMSYL